jgi:hypothetical protein
MVEERRRMFRKSGKRKGVGKPANGWKRYARAAQRAAKIAWNSTRKIWSLQGAAVIISVAAIVSIIQILVAVHGKLVILPFEVRSDQNTPADMGASLSASLSVALNEYRSLYPSAKPDKERKTLTNENYFDLVQHFMTSVLPSVEIPHSSTLSKGATVLEAIKIGPVSIPVSQLIFENLAFFHKDTLRGTVEVWGNELTARILLGDDETITVSVPKEQGYRALINRITVELLEKKQWIFPIPMKLSALTPFSEGLRNYLDYDAHGEDRFINSARVKYEAALEADKNADLARLHLAAAQYISTEPVIIAKAVENFSLLLSHPRLKRAAEIGYVASSLRYIERADGCSGVYRFLAPALRVVKSWEKNGTPPAEIEELLLWSGTFHLTSEYALPGEPCTQWIQTMLGEGDVDKCWRIRSKVTKKPRSGSRNWADAPMVRPSDMNFIFFSRRNICSTTWSTIRCFRRSQI